MNIETWLHNLLLLKTNDIESEWYLICKGMLQEYDPKTSASVDQPSFDILQEMINEKIKNNGIFAAGAIQRPYYVAMSNTLEYTHNHNGKLPKVLLDNPLNLLKTNNTDRLNEIEHSFQLALNTDDKWSSLETFLFKDLTVDEWRIWLRMRCTTGTKKFSIMPPSLNECMIAFTTIYKKQNTKGKKQQPHTLTNGAKALSKHWHRDRETGFWGNCTGSDSTKNLYAVKVLFRIMTNAVWINMHSLPHDEIVYEIREINGYGARWTTFNQNEWTFRGFLEPQMENGHEIGWVH